MQLTMTTGQAVPLMLSAAERIGQSRRRLHREAAELMTSAARWLAENGEEAAACACIPLFMAFGVAMYVLAAVLQGGVL